MCTTEWLSPTQAVIIELKTGVQQLHTRVDIDDIEFGEVIGHLIELAAGNKDKAQTLIDKLDTIIKRLGKRILFFESAINELTLGQIAEDVLYRENLEVAFEDI